MAISVTVTHVSGSAWVRHPDGSLVALRPGATVAKDSEVITAPGASVTLAQAGSTPITLDEDGSFALTDVLATPADVGTAIPPQAEIPDSARLLNPHSASASGAGLRAPTAMAGGPGEDDGSKAATILEITIAGTDTTPKLIDHSHEGWEDQALTGNLLDGASAYGGGSLTVTQFAFLSPTGGMVANPGQSITLANFGVLTVAADSTYTFTPEPNWNGQTPTFTYWVTDGTNTSQATLGITIHPVNDAPESEDNGVHVNEGSTYVFSVNNFPFSDPVDANFGAAPAHHFAAVIIDSLPQGGTLFFNGTAVTQSMVNTGLSVNKSDLEDGLLTWQAPVTTSSNGCQATRVRRPTPPTT